MGKIISFTDLIVWKKAHTLSLKIYKVSNCFPRVEDYGLKDQIRRASVSVTSNIVEGFYRRTQADKSYFYYLSLGSLGEIQSQLYLIHDLKYVQTSECNGLCSEIIEIRRLLLGLIKTSITKPVFNTKY